MDPSLLAPVIAGAAVAIGATATALGVIISARYTASIKLAVAQHELGCRNVRDLAGAIRDLVARLDRLVDHQEAR